jgi:glycosyltransferase involved in cell wall biosynthesis
MGDVMKIVMITECLAGGVLTYLNNVCNELNDRGYKVHVLYSSKEQTPTKEKLKSMFNENIILKEIPFQRNKIMDYFSLYYEYKKYIEYVNPDVVHFHSSFSGAIGRLVVFFNKKYKLKSFYTPHGYSFLKKDNSAIHNIIFKTLEYVLTKLETKTTILAISKSEYNESLKITSNTRLVSTGIDHILINSFIKGLLKEKNTKKQIVSLGRLSFQKNPRLFLEIAKKCKERGLDVKFIWIGGGELYDEVITFIKENKLENYVEVTGWLPYHEAISMLFKKGDIYLQTSLWEGLPLTILEAMYLEKALIVNNTLGNTDAIIHGENGFICNHIDEFVDIISKLISDDKTYSKITQNARKTVENEYLIRHNVRLLEEQYNKN